MHGRTICVMSTWNNKVRNVFGVAPYYSKREIFNLAANYGLGGTAFYSVKSLDERFDSYEYCDEKERPVRKMILDDVKKMGGRLLPSSMKVIPYDKPGEFTEIIYVDIAFDMKLPETFFSLRNLKQQGD